MSNFSKFPLILFILWFSSSVTYSQVKDTAAIRTNNFNIIKSLEERYSIRIFFDNAIVNKTILNAVPDNGLLLEEALNTMVAGMELTCMKIQQTSYMLVPREAIRNITEKLDTLLKSESGSLIIGSLENYKKNKAAVIKGLVLDGKTGKPVPGAVIVIKSLDLGIASDAKGTYTLLVKPGNYTLLISSLGFEEFTSQIKVLSSGSLTVELFEKTIKLEEVSIYARRADRNITGDQMSLVELDRKTIKQLPLLSGEKDLIKSFTMLPGIKSTGEFGTGISVRGGGNDQNLFLIEETPLYNTSHVFGLITAISSDIVSNVSLYKGFIPADYGERASSVIEIQLKRGNEKKYNANGGIGLFSSRLAIEGPVVKDKISFLVAGRSSYSDWLLNRIPDVELANSKANFYDIFAGINARIAEKHRLFCMFYNSYDFFNYDNQLHYSNKNTAGEIKWNYFKKTSLDYSLALSYSENGILKKDLENTVTSYRSENAIYSLSLKADVNYILNRNHTIKAGLQAIRYSVNPGSQVPSDTLSSAGNIELGHNKGIETALYVTDNITLNNAISLNLGLRYSMFFSLGPYSVYNYQSGLPLSDATIMEPTLYKTNEVIRFYQGAEPRISFRYQFGSSTSAKISYNRNIQYLSLISASAVQSPDDIWQLANTYIKPIINNTVALGFYKNFKQNTIETSIEFYYRSLHNLTDYKNGARLNMNPHIETELINANGRSYGAEVLLKKKLGDLDGWIGYTYSRSLKKTYGMYTEEIINGNDYYPSNYDKPHDFNMMFTYHYNRRLRFSGNFTYSSGRAVTLPEAIYYTDNSWKVSYRERNSERLPDYHRLDLSVSVDESLRLKKKWKGSWTFSVLNVYGRKNAYSLFFKSEIPTKENKYRNFGLYKLYIIGRPLPTITYNFIF